MIFGGEKVTDGKRLARGEHLHLARTFLRQRDEVHHRSWRVMVMAGGQPSGELSAIRELMPKAHVTAIDCDPRCLELAIEAGADEVVHCKDVLALTETKVPSQYGVQTTRSLDPSLEVLEKFDLIHLDLCGGPTTEFRMALALFTSRLVQTGGVVITTWSYGRDVVERYLNQSYGWKVRDEWCELPDIIPTPLRCRVGSMGMLVKLRSVLSYRGAEMPMCSCLYAKSRTNLGKVSYAHCDQSDLELAVTVPDPAKLYDCPQERIESLRRQHAALKAAITRQRKTEQRRTA